MHRITVIAAGLVGWMAGCAAQEASDAALATSTAEKLTQHNARAQPGWDALVSWDDMPMFSSSAVRNFSSTERENSGVWFPLDVGNKDFNNFLAVCGGRPALTYQFVDDTVACAPGEEGYLLAAIDGAGYVSRMGFGGATLDLTTQIDSGLPIQPHPNNELIKLYVDDAQDAVYVGRWSDWDKGTQPPFTSPLTGWSSGFIVNYVPISFQHRLRIFADALNPTLYAYYYDVSVHSVTTTESFNAAALKSDEAQKAIENIAARATQGTDTWVDSQVSFEGDASQTVWQSTEPGTIEQIELDLEAASTAHVTLRLFWDDEQTPALDSTLADLFGARLSKDATPEYQTWPMAVTRTDSTSHLRLTLPMPYARGARVTLASNAAAVGGVHVRILGRNTLPIEPWGSLRTQQTTRTQPKQGERFVVADLSGRGKYIGTLLYMVGGPNEASILPGPMPLNFLEGDDLIEIDGNVSQGTGTEETFNAGWYFSDGRFQSPFAALLHIDHSTPERGEISAVRWNILSDSLPFQDHFRLSYEYGSNAAQTAIEYSAIAFYYASH